MPAPLTAALAGLAAGFVGWILVVVCVLVAWIPAQAGSLGGALGVATQVWLLAHGGGLRLGQVTWTLIPLGLTLMCGGVIALAARWALPRDSGSTTSLDSSDPRGIDRVLMRTRAIGTALPLAGAYAAPLLLAGLLMGNPAQGLLAAVAGAVLALLATAWIIQRRERLAWREVLPGWARSLPSAVAIAIWTLLLGGAVALTVSLIQHRQLIGSIADGLGVSGGSMAQLIGAQLAYWPNLVIWAGAWTLGAGFRFGTDSVVSPAATDLGLIPSVPVLGALPAEGAGRWLLLWLVTGVIAGMLASWVVVRGRPTARLEETTGVSALAGVLTILAYALLALLSRGDLGTERLTGLGPRMGELLLLAGALVGLTATLMGFVVGLVRTMSRRSVEAAGARDTDVDESAAAKEVAGDPLDEDEVTTTLGDRVDP